MNMARGALVALALILSFGSIAEAQTPDHWKTAEECVAATSSPYYFPSILTQRKLGTGEVVRGIPYGACVEMDLPDRLGGRGYVRIDSGRAFVYGPGGAILRLSECNNRVYNVVPLPLVQGSNGDQGLTGPRGLQGLEGPAGRDGKDGRDGRDFTPERRVFKEERSFPWKTFLIGGVVTAVGIVAITHDWSRDGKPRPSVPATPATPAPGPPNVEVLPPSPGPTPGPPHLGLHFAIRF